MATPNMMLLYVEDMDASGAFYSRLLGREPVEATSGFRAYALEGGLMLALWRRNVVQPGTQATGGGTGELVFNVDAPAKVDAVHAEWIGRGAAIVQAPVDLEFGRTFLAVDPDGHRLRVVAAN